MLVSLIIPCYNEEEALPFLYNALCDVRKEVKDHDFEFIFVNDGSRDKTSEVIKKFAAEDKDVRYIIFSRNFGKEAAMYAGLKKSKGDMVAIMDADMQDPPSLIPSMIKSIENNEADIVASRRVNREGEPKIRSFFARMFYKLINRMVEVEIADGARDFRLMTRQVSKYRANRGRDQVEFLEALQVRDRRYRRLHDCSSKTCYILGIRIRRLGVLLPGLLLYKGDNP